MSDLVLNINTKELQDMVKDLDENHVRGVLQNAAASLAVQTHAHVVEKAHEKMKSRREMYVKQLDLKKLDDGVHAVILYQPAMWIEEGMPAHEMIDDLLKKNAKIAEGKHGEQYRYKVIPFQHDKAPTRMAPAALDLRNTLKAYMDKNKIPWHKIERRADGVPLEGLVRKFDLDLPDRPHSRPHTPFGPGGPTESWEAQGPKSYRTRSPWTGLSHLHGVRIYQRILRDEHGNMRRNKKGEIMASRNIFTFRVVSDKQKGTGMWQYPGIAGVRLLDEAYDWAKDHFEKVMLPDILNQLGIS